MKIFSPVENFLVCQVPRKRARMILSAALLAVLLFCAALALAPHGMGRAEARESVPPPRAAAISRTLPVRSAAAQASPAPAVAVTFTLYDVGIEPALLHARAGNIEIDMEDMSGYSAGIVLQTIPAPGTSSTALTLGQATRSEDPVAGAWRGSLQVQLAAGAYKVYDASRPNNQAELIVDP